MAKNYKKRLKAHKLRLFKKLFSVSLFPLILILFVITIQLLRPAPDKWETESIVLDSIGSTSVMGHKSSKTVAKIVDVDGQSYVLSQMKPDEASSVLTTGDKYDVVYSSEFGRLRIKGLYKNGAEIINFNSALVSELLREDINIVPETIHSIHSIQTTLSTHNHIMQINEIKKH